MMDLFDLVNSFIEKGYGAYVVDDEEEIVDHHDSDDDGDSQDSDVKDSLKRLFAFNNSDEARRNATVEIQKAWRRVINDASLSPDFKLQLMAQLRAQGLDAGVCKSKWEKNGKIPSGYYEYIDANINGTRYIIDVSLAAEFEIARPTETYTLLLDLFPQITVFKVRELKQIVRIMCDAIRKSMRQRRMHVPPWRRHAYVQAKWFASYKRVTSHETTFLQAKSVPDSNVNGVAGLLSFPGRSCYRSRRNGFGRTGFGLEIGHLAMAMNGAN